VGDPWSDGRHGCPYLMSHSVFAWRVAHPSAIHFPLNLLHPVEATYPVEHGRPFSSEYPSWVIPALPDLIYSLDAVCRTLNLLGRMELESVYIWGWGLLLLALSWHVISVIILCKVQSLIWSFFTSMF